MPSDQVDKAGGGPRHRRESIVFEPEVAEGALLVQGYGPTGFKIGNRRFETAVLLSAHRVIDLDATTLESLADADPTAWFDPDDRPELVFLGCGAKADLPPKALRDAFQALGIALEPMDTGAAARTYNVLLIEGRRVAALLLPASP